MGYNITFKDQQEESIRVYQSITYHLIYTESKRLQNMVQMLTYYPIIKKKNLASVHVKQDQN